MAKLTGLTIFICPLRSYLCALYGRFCRLLPPGREKKAEDVAETGGPGVFVVGCVGDLEVVEIDSVVPAAELKAAVEEIGVVDVLMAFCGAYVQPDAEVGPGVGAGDEVEQAAVIPPDTGGKGGDFAEDAGVIEAEDERDEAAEGGASEGGIGGVGEGAEGGVDEGLEVVDQELAVEGAFATAELGVAGGGVLGHAAGTGVGDADEDEGLDETGAGELVGGGVGAPGVAGEESGAVVEEVLSVVQIEDGEALVGVGEVGFWEINSDVARAGQEAGLEGREDAVTRVVIELAGGGGCGITFRKQVRVLGWRVVG